MNGYEDIMMMPRHVSTTRAPMGRWNRAAQFSPFAALTGYDAEISEAMRVTYPKLYLSVDMQEEINEKLVELVEGIAQQPQVSLTYFVRDLKKSGGEYVTAVGQLKRFDEYERSLVLTDGRKIPVDEIYNVSTAFL